jgi:hypothetical protein
MKNRLWTVFRKIGEAPARHPLGEEVLLQAETYRHAEWNNLRISQFCSIECKFRDCRFSNIDVDQLTFGGGKVESVYERCVFDGVRAKLAIVGRSRFVDCDFINVDLSGFKFIAADLIRCRISGTLRKGYISAVRNKEALAVFGLSGANCIDGNDFSASELVQFDFRGGVDLIKNCPPNKATYIIISDGRAAVYNLLDTLPKSHLAAEEKVGVAAVVDALQSAVEEGQTQLLIREDDFGYLPRASRSFLFQGLRQFSDSTGREIRPR